MSMRREDGRDDTDRIKTSKADDHGGLSYVYEQDVVTETVTESVTLAATLCD